MKTALKCIVLLLIIGVVIYAVFSFFFGKLTETQGRETVRDLRPFTSGAAKEAAIQTKKTLESIPDAKLEKETRELSRKLYPVNKGLILGQIDGYLADPNRDELLKKAREVGKAISQDVVGSISGQVSEGSQKAVSELDKTLEGVRKLKESNKDLFDSLSRGLGELQKVIQQLPRLPQPGADESSPPAAAPSTPKQEPQPAR